MKKKGFTLIELLAVIVILAIIALIATPAVLNIIEDSRKGAAEASARNIVSTAKTYYMSETMQGRTVGSINLSDGTLKYDGDQASKGSITFTDGKSSGKMYINGYCVEVNANGNVVSEKVDEEDCEIESTPVTTISYADGTPLLYDPVNNVACETSIGSSTGTNNGCMKWYAFLTDENSETVNLILDHNTTAYVAWNSTYGTTPDTVNAQLQADITNWNASVKSTARLISASEVNQIAPTAEGFTWTETDTSTWYYLHTGFTGVSNIYQGAAGSNTYAWLFDNTNGCETYGCNTADSGTKGYWTSSFASSGIAWGVSGPGSMSIGMVSNVGNAGVRPVITVSKDVFK